MPTKVIKSSRETSVNIQTDNTVWQIGDGVAIRTFDSPALNVKAGAEGNTLEIDGDLIAMGGDGAGVYSEGLDTRIIFGDTAHVFARNGVHSIAAGAVITNDGAINATNVGVGLSAGGSVVNSGDLRGGAFGIFAAGSKNDARAAHAAAADADFSVVNKSGGLIIGGGIAIYATGDTEIVNAAGAVILADDAIRAEGQLTLTNRGEILAGDEAVIAASLADKIVNRGVIEGDVELGDGNDLFDTAGGTIRGTVFGGLGDDIYTVSAGRVAIVEYSGEGNDTVKAAVGHTLAADIEKLVLTGTAAINGAGNGLDNTLIGNAAANTLNGKDGADLLSGGKGADILTGGAGGDVFDFSSGAGFGIDTITDFTDGEDIIRMIDFPGVDDFADLAGKISQKGDDVWISLAGGDRIVIQDMLKADLGAGDMAFSIIA